MGKFILLTLFLAVTLDAFERKYEVRQCMASAASELADFWGRRRQARHNRRDPGG
jgi:hypothetical protein